MDLAHLPTRPGPSPGPRQIPPAKPADPADPAVPAVPSPVPRDSGPL